MFICVMKTLNSTDFNFIYLQHGTNEVDPKLYFWDIEADSLSYFNFDSGKGEQDDYPPEQMVGMQSGSAIEMSAADR